MDAVPPIRFVVVQDWTCDCVVGDEPELGGVKLFFAIRDRGFNVINFVGAKGIFALNFAVWTA